MMCRTISINSSHSRAGKAAVCSTMSRVPRLGAEDFEERPERLPEGGAEHGIPGQEAADNRIALD